MHRCKFNIKSSFLGGQTKLLAYFTDIEKFAFDLHLISIRYFYFRSVSAQYIKTIFFCRRALSFCVQRSLLPRARLFNFYYFVVLYTVLILFFLSSARHNKTPRLSFISFAVGRYWNTATINGPGSPTINF